ncbi:MAG: type II toxin-antitoxin system VapC family toxin [Patescibacteria group bacterium]|nr:type II toxin-antitoxin system VapC family toxin [Patescibacteria group bacterium]
MPCLIDTSILVRLANANDVQHDIATHAVLELHRRGETLHLTPQVMVEFRSVATRPAEVNGLGLSAEDTEELATEFEARFPMLTETPAIYPAWKDIVASVAIVGKQVHDARLVAVCHVHSVTHLMTFNAAHFTRFAGYGAGIMVVNPAGEAGRG